MSRRPLRRLALVAMSPALAKPEREEDPWRFPSYGVRRIEASIRAAPELAEVELEVLELVDLSAEELAVRLLDLRPDAVGFSAYIWSFPAFAAAAERLRQLDPALTLFFGGPSAEPAMFALEPFAGAAAAVDFLVLGEGERAVREALAALAGGPDGLARVPGLALPSADGWRRTAARPLDLRLDELPSPVQLGLMPRRSVGYLETFRGCPLSCTFCEWGVMAPGACFSEAYLERELTALAALDPVTTYLLDAALNLNQRALRNLLAAERRVGCFARRSLIALLYPRPLDRDQQELLARVGELYLSIGVQSLDDQVLSGIDRRGRRGVLAPLVGELGSLPNVRSLALELIFGLPEESPERFRRGLDELLGLGCGVRVYHCLVLPNGLMSRAPAAQEVRFDPRTLKLTAAAGWSERALATEADRLSQAAAARSGGYAGDYWWYFPPDRSPRGAAGG